MVQSLKQTNPFLRDNKLVEEMIKINVLSSTRIECEISDEVFNDNKASI
jgi:hypothetical protein